MNAHDAALELYRAEARTKGETFPGDPPVLGLDPSATSTGVAHVDGRFSTIRPHTTAPKTATDRARRLHEIVSLFDAHVGDGWPRLAVVEAYSLAGPRGYAAAYVAEVGGVLRRHLFERGACLLEVPPSRLKLYATGDGGRRTGKDQMVAAAALDLRGHRGAPVPRNADEADAYWLRRLGLDLVLAPVEDGLPPGLSAARRKIRDAYAAEVRRCVS